MTPDGSLIPQTPLLEALKSETSELHNEIEKHVRFMREGLTVEAYRSELARYLGFYRAVEARLLKSAHFAPPSLTLPARMKVNWICSDLLALGETAESLKRLPECRHMVEIESVGDLIGVLYVLEGSTLGGQMIARHLKKRPEFSSVQMRFLEGYGAETGSMWQRFRAFAVEHDGGPNQSAALVSARAAFRYFIEWLRTQS